MSNLRVDQTLKVVVENSIIPDLEAENAKLQQRLEFLMQIIYCVDTSELDICFDCLTIGQFKDSCFKCGLIICKKCKASERCFDCSTFVHDKCINKLRDNYCECCGCSLKKLNDQ